MKAECRITKNDCRLYGNSNMENMFPIMFQLTYMSLTLRSSVCLSFNVFNRGVMYHFFIKVFMRLKNLISELNTLITLPTRLTRKVGLSVPNNVCGWGSFSRNIRVSLAHQHTLKKGALCTKIICNHKASLIILHVFLTQCSISIATYCLAISKWISELL